MAGKRRGPTGYVWYVCTIGYVEWHEEAERRTAAGERSVKCDRGRFYFPAWVEDRARPFDSGYLMQKCPRCIGGVERIVEAVDE